MLYLQRCARGHLQNRHRDPLRLQILSTQPPSRQSARESRVHPSPVTVYSEVRALGTTPHAPPCCFLGPGMWSRVLPESSRSRAYRSALCVTGVKEDRRLELQRSTGMKHRRKLQLQNELINCFCLNGFGFRPACVDSLAHAPGSGRHPQIACDTLPLPGDFPLHMWTMRMR